MKAGLNKPLELSLNPRICLYGNTYDLSYYERLASTFS